jgi:hypothetical protein
MVPLPNFTTYDTKTEKKSGGILSKILYWLRKALLPPGYKKLSNKDFSPFLRINKKYKDTFFNVPVMEAVITSRWEQTKNYWMIPLLLYIIFLFLFSYLSQLLLRDSEYKNHSEPVLMIIVGLFYYSGIYLLIVDFMKMRKYKSKYFTIFNIFDLCSIVLGVIVFTLILIKSFNDEDVDDKGIIILMTGTTLILWIEMVS